MHVADWFTTLLRAAGVSPPTDRVIDGVDQLEWLTGSADSSPREGFIVWMGPEMYGAKWHDFKLVLVIQKYLTDPALRLATPHLINLITDPQEREPIPLPHLHTWAATTGSSASSRQASSEPLIPAGAPLDHEPVAHVLAARVAARWVGCSHR